MEDTSSDTSVDPGADATADSDAAFDSDTAEPHVPEPFAPRPDFDGDGKADLFCHPGGADGSTYVASVGDSGLAWSATPWISKWCTGVRIGSGDFDGDHRSDLYCTTGAQLSVATSTGALHSFVLLSGAVKEVYCDLSNAFIGDFNGDGKDDFLCHNGLGDSEYAGTSWVTLSTGKGFATASAWIDGFCSWTGSEFGVGDFDGDGKADLWCHDAHSPSEHRTWVARSTGSSFVAIAGPVRSRFCGDLVGDEFGAADFDGDGRTDFYCHGATGQMTVALTQGGLEFPETTVSLWTSSFCAGGTLGTADFDGDGDADLYCHTSVGATFAFADPKAATIDGGFAEKFTAGSKPLTGCEKAGDQFGAIK